MRKYHIYDTVKKFISCFILWSSGFTLGKQNEVMQERNLGRNKNKNILFSDGWSKNLPMDTGLSAEKNISTYTKY